MKRVTLVLFSVAICLFAASLANANVISVTGPTVNGPGIVGTINAVHPTTAPCPALWAGGCLNWWTPQANEIDRKAAGQPYQAGDDNLPGTYWYAFTFDATGLPNNQKIAGTWAVDDTGGVFLNTQLGAPLFSLGYPGYQGPAQPFTINGFNTGANTLYFKIVNNDWRPDSSGGFGPLGENPTGLYANFTVTADPIAVIPEPASLLLLGTGLGVLGLFSRRKK